MNSQVIGQVFVLIFLLIIWYATRFDLLIGSVLGSSLGLITALFVWGYDNSGRIRIWLCSHFIERNKPIRITSAYLFRIEIDGRYLLIQNEHKMNGYQPVGGVYKYRKNELDSLFNKIEAIPDNKIKQSKKVENDLRLRLKKRKNLFKYIRWLEKRENREIDPWREFYEELLEPGLLDQKLFPYIQYKFVKHCKKYGYSEHFNIMEYKTADIYQLVFTSEAQKNAVKELMKSDNSKIIAVTADEVNNGQTLKLEHEIRPHTKKIL